MKEFRIYSLILALLLPHNFDTNAPYLLHRFRLGQSKTYNFATRCRLIVLNGIPMAALVTRLALAVHSVLRHDWKLFLAHIKMMHLWLKKLIW